MFTAPFITFSAFNHADKYSPVQFRWDILRFPGFDVDVKIMRRNPFAPQKLIPAGQSLVYKFGIALYDAMQVKRSKEIAMEMEAREAKHKAQKEAREQVRLDTVRYEVFHRNWYKPATSRSWPDGLEPTALARKTYLAKSVTYAEAKQICDEYNRTHKPGRYCRKAEFRRIG